MRQLYVTTNCSTPTLLGVLTELSPGAGEPYGRRGEYRFEYTLQNAPPNAHLQMEHFPILSQVYSGATVMEWLKSYLPSTNGRHFFSALMESAGLSFYDEWEWLKVFGNRNVNTSVRLYDELPRGTVRYDT
jgi:hypothetical protein